MVGQDGVVQAMVEVGGAHKPVAREEEEEGEEEEEEEKEGGEEDVEEAVGTAEVGEAKVAVATESIVIAVAAGFVEQTAAIVL